MRAATVVEVGWRWSEPAYEFVTVRLPLGGSPRLGTSVTMQWYDPPVAPAPVDLTKEKRS